MADNSNPDWIFINSETFVSDQKNLILNQIILEYSNVLGIDSNFASLAFGEKENSVNFFEKIIDQPVYFSNDHTKIRQLIIDWYSANKTEVTKSRNITDLNLLTNEELNEFILSFGFPYPRNIISKSGKIQFLLGLINSYKTKGTPSTLANVITLFGLRNIIISEWWIRYDSRRDKKIFARSNVVYPKLLRSDKEYETEKSYDEFIRNNPHWHLPEEQINNSFNDPLNKISLPSITSNISIETYTNLNELEIIVAVFQRMIQESIDFWIRYSLISISNIDNTVNLPTHMYVINTPPETTDITQDTYFLVGPEPTDDFTDYAKKIAMWDYSASEWVFTEPSNREGVLVKENSIISEGSVLIYNLSKTKWDIYTVKKDTTIPVRTHTRDSTSTFVFNGTEWIDLEKYIPVEKILNRNENLYRTIPLNNFSSLYSIIEIQLMMAYLFNGPYTEYSSKRHINYNGKYAPLNIGYAVDYSGAPVPVRDGIDTLYLGSDAYAPIYDEYMNLIYDTDKLNANNKAKSFRHFYDNSIEPRKARKLRLDEYYSKFTKKNDYSSSQNLYCQTNPEPFLKAINPVMYSELQTALSNDSTAIVLETIMADLENYAIQNMNLIKGPFAYLQTGASFLNEKLLPVIDFYKPLRVRLLEFLTKLKIDSPLHDSLLMKTSLINTDINLTFVEKPFPRNIDTTGSFEIIDDVPVLDYVLDKGISFQSKVLCDIEVTVDELRYSPYDKDDSINRLDSTLNDFIIVSISDGSGILQTWKSDDGGIYDIDSTTGRSHLYHTPIDE